MKVKYVLFSVGLLYLTFSEFVFIQIHDVMPFIWIVSALICIVTFIMILLAKEPKKRKLIWVGIGMAAFCVRAFTHQFQFETSCKWYITSNKETLESIVRTVQTTGNDIHIWQNGQLADSSSYKSIETDLQEKMHAVGVQRIAGAKQSIDKIRLHFELWGFLDSRFGFTYTEDPNSDDVPVVGNWYR